MNYDRLHPPLQIDLFIDTDGLTATVQIYLNLPIVGLLSQAIGALKFNSDIEVEFTGGLVSGAAVIRVDTNNNVFAFWDFTSFETGTKGSLVI
jgi:hypothetical protein